MSQKLLKVVPVRQAMLILEEKKFAISVIILVRNVKTKLILTAQNALWEKTDKI